MSRKSIYFDFVPIPKYFFEKGWFKDHNCLIYVNWAFSRCTATSKNVFFLHKEIKLEPFEYISGLHECSKETGLSVRQIRTQQDHLMFSQILEKSTNKSTNKYTVYRWVTAKFSEYGDKQNDTRATSKRQAGDNKQDSKIVDIEEQLQDSEKVGVFSCLDKLKLTVEDKQKLMKFSEERVKLAIEFSKTEPIKTSLIQVLYWHCDQKTPPVSLKSLLTAQQQEATNYNETVKSKHYEENKKTIENHFMMIFINGIYQSISLKSDINTVKTDLEQSRKELKKRKAE